MLNIRFLALSIITALCVFSCVNKKESSQEPKAENKIDSIRVNYYNYTPLEQDTTSCESLLNVRETILNEYRKGVISSLIANNDPIFKDFARLVPLSEAEPFQATIAIKVYYSDGKVDNYCSDGECLSKDNVLYADSLHKSTTEIMFSLAKRFDHFTEERRQEIERIRRMKAIMGNPRESSPR